MELLGALYTQPPAYLITNEQSKYLLLIFFNPYLFT